MNNTEKYIKGMGNVITFKRILGMIENGEADPNDPAIENAANILNQFIIGCGNKDERHDKGQNNDGLDR